MKIQWYSICECNLFRAFYKYIKHYSMKSTKVFHKSKVYIGIISFKALEVSRKKNILFKKKKKKATFSLAYASFIQFQSFASKSERYYYVLTYHNPFSIKGSATSDIFKIITAWVLSWLRLPATKKNVWKITEWN